MKHARLAPLLALATCVPQPDARPVVRPGLEVAVSDSVHLLRGHRVGLVANQATIDRQGRHGVELLRAAGINLVALLSPEHGFRGSAAPGEHVASSVDTATGLPIYSLYSKTYAPTDSMLRGIDLLVVDLPDVGARYFTYLSTLLEVMKSAAPRGLRVMVLDRPDPIGGTLVQGNVLDPAHRSFVGPLAVPMRHGMTLGELGRLGNDELGIRGELVVIPATGWRRSQDQLATGLPFVAPSRNLTDLEGLFHYPGTCLFEGTALSVGRGTTHPFHQVGAPWLDTAGVLASLARTPVPGMRFEAVRFRPHQPDDGKWADTELAGIRFVVTDRAQYDPTAAAVRLLTAVWERHPTEMGFVPAQFDRLAGGSELRLAVEGGESADSILERWRAPLERFRERRAGYLLYPE
ncbi:MAG: exo-beta-N-acetylmuramidase NamZ domain-containing protein [Gemmatimonadales bacterium]